MKVRVRVRVGLELGLELNLWSGLGLVLLITVCIRVTVRVIVRVRVSYQERSSYLEEKGRILYELPDWIFSQKISTFESLSLLDCSCQNPRACSTSCMMIPLRLQPSPRDIRLTLASLYIRPTKEKHLGTKNIIMPGG